MITVTNTTTKQKQIFAANTVANIAVQYDNSWAFVEKDM